VAAEWGAGGGEVEDGKYINKFRGAKRNRLPMTIFKSELRFTLESYSELGSLAFQSRMTKSLPVRTVVTFRDARAFEIRHECEGVVVEAEHSEDFFDLRPDLKTIMEPGLHVYLLRTREWQGYIIAGAIYHEETKVVFTDYPPTAQN
jgi:hypothetical protein